MPVFEYKGLDGGGKAINGIIDADSAKKFDTAAQQWLSKRGFDVQLEFGVEDGFHVINGKGADWCPRVYVAMITELFQQGLTKCLVGTRGLLGDCLLYTSPSPRD